MWVSPADHVVPDAAAFAQAVTVGMDAAEAGQLVTFGITPTHAETGYGYLELSEPPGEGADAKPVALSRFVEKPDAETAAKLVASGTHLWNAGIFLFKTATIIEAFRTHAPSLMDPVEAAVTEAKPDLGFLRLAAAPWAEADSISIDYAVMERADNLSVVPFSAGWSDLGGWDAVWRESGRDTRGVATSGPATAIDCDDTLLRSEDAGLQVVGIGLKDVITVAMPDAVLVADASRAQDVKLAVAALKEKQAKQAEAFPKDHPPGAGLKASSWGIAFRSNASWSIPARR